MHETSFLHLPTTKLAYRVIEHKASKTDSCCLMLHGAGVAGVLTYEPMLEYLNHWRWLLIPDLNGMGESFHQETPEAPLNVETLAEEMAALVLHVGWSKFDVIGYSLGGLVALLLNRIALNAQMSIPHLILMEPASLDRECVSTLAEVRKRYRSASETIRETGDVELGIAHFMDGVAPNRRKHPIAEATTQSRLAHRPIGFSYALDAVTDWVERVSEAPTLREDLIVSAKEVLLFSGELSHELLKSHYDELASQNMGWTHEVMAGCDHSLPFQKPRQIAKMIEAWLDKKD